MKKNKKLLRTFFQNIKTIFKFQYNRWAYIKSFKQMAKDENVLTIAEEGMEDYFAQTKNLS